MKALSSSGLHQYTAHCPLALDHYEAHAPYDRSVFGAGISAHAVMQAWGESRNEPPAYLPALAESVALRLSTEGRSYAGHAEDPIPFEAALSGARLSQRWLETHDFPPGRVEVGIAVDADWHVVDYLDPSAMYRGILDVLHEETTEDEEGYQTTGLVIRDWKTAWTAGPNDLDSIQLHGYVLLALADFEARHPGQSPTWVRREITNLRTHATYSANLDLDDAGIATLEEWRRDLTTLIRAANIRPRKAIPGPRCMGCPYVLSCDPARSWWTFWMPQDDMAPDVIARRYATLHAAADALEPTLREALSDRGSLPVPGGSVGYHAKTEREPVSRAVVPLVLEWLRVQDENRGEWEASNGSLLTFLDALDLGSGNIERAIKRLTPLQSRGGVKVTRDQKEINREHRAELEARSFTERVKVLFGIQSDAKTVNIDGDPAAQTTPTPTETP